MNAGTLINLENTLVNYGGCSSLVRYVNEARSLVETYSQEKVQYVAIGAFKGMLVGGVLGGGAAYGGSIGGGAIFGALTGYGPFSGMTIKTVDGLVSPVLIKYTGETALVSAITACATLAIPSIGMVAGFASVCAGIGGMKNAWDTYSYNVKADQASRMEAILIRCLSFIKAGAEGVSADYEDEFIREIIARHNVCNWTNESFQLNPTFDEYNGLKPGLSLRIQSIVLIAITTISSTKRSTASTIDALQRTINQMETNEDNRELVSFSRFHLGKCFLETGAVESAKREYREILSPGGTQNQNLMNSAQYALDRLG